MLPEPLVLGPGPQPRDQQRAQLLPVGGAVGVAREPRVVGQLRDAEHLAEPAELAVVAGRDDHLAVGGRQRVVREQARVRVAHPGRGHAGRDHRAEWLTSPDSAEDIRLTSTCCPRPVRLAGVQRGQHPDQRVHPGHHVEDRDAGPVRLAAGRPGQAHQPGDRLHDQVVAGQRGAAAGAEAGDRGVDDARVGRRHRVVVEPEAGQPAGAEVLQQDVGPAGQLAGQRGVLLVLEVERDRALVAVDAEVVGRDAVPDRRHPGAGVVAARALHLDHLGAEVGQQHRRVRPGEDPGEVGDQQAAQRAARTLGRRAVRSQLGRAGALLDRLHRAPSSAIRTVVRETIVGGHHTGVNRPSAPPGPTGGGRSRRSPRRPPAAAAAGSRRSAWRPRSRPRAR